MSSELHAASPFVSNSRIVSSLEKNLVFQRFYALVDSIPKGRLATYGQIAKEAGLPRHARHVGHALRQLPAGSKLPWHRVVSSDGSIAARPGSSEGKQAKRLRAEGIEVSPAGRVRLATYRWNPED